MVHVDLLKSWTLPLVLDKCVCGIAPLSRGPLCLPTKTFKNSHAFQSSKASPRPTNRVRDFKSRRGTAFIKDQ